MSHALLGEIFFALLVFAAPLAVAGADEASTRAIVWNFDNLEKIGGHKPVVLGAPKVIETPGGKALEFDGKGDALLLDANPLAGLKQFTAEVVFKPYADGPKEQRFFHLQETGSENRLLFETRLADDGQWFLDTFIKSGTGDHTLFAEKSPHPIGLWYQAAIVMDGKTMRHYVNGVEELKTEIDFAPQKAGTASVGVRINKVFWYRGAISQFRLTPAVLTPKEFLKP